MEITKTMKQDLLAQVTIKLDKPDYEARVTGVLKDHAKKSNMPGFRPGKVPFGLIRKQYGTSVLVDEVNRMLVDKLYEYINAEKLEVLGNPLPSTETEAKVDWENPAEMEFHYDLALAPELKIDVNKKRKFTQYMIEPTDKDVDQSLENISKRNGEMMEMTEARADDLVKVQWVELTEEGEIKEGGVLHSSSVSMKTLNDDMKKVFVGKKLEDVFEVNPLEVSNNESDRAAMLGVKKEALGEVSNRFKVMVEMIQRLNPAELNEDLFKKLYPDGSITNLEGMKEQVRTDYRNYFSGESDRKLKNDIVVELLKEAKISLPDDFLKRWLVSVNKEKNITREQVESEYNQYSDGLRWQLIENKTIKENELSVSEEELREGVGHHVRRQFAQYGINQADDEMMNEMIDNFMKREEEVRKVNEVLYDQKILTHLKSKYELKEKTMNSEDFYAMLQAEQK
jgi:trigger factor